MNTPFQFVPSLSTVPYNHGMAETFSWIGFDDASVPRPFYARACYVTNLSDLTVSLCAADIRIGGVEIVDNDTSLRCDVTTFTYEDGSYNALRVVNQDLDPELDTVSLADKNSNNVTVYAATSSLNVHVTNFSPLTSLVEKEFNETQTLIDGLTSLQNIKQNRIITLLDQLTANTDSIDVNTDDVEALVTITNTKIDALTAVDYATYTEQNIQSTLLNVLTAKDYATAVNQDVIITLLNALTANEQEFNLNTDSIEELLTATNTFLSILTAKDYATSVKQDTQITLLDALTGVSTAITANQYTALTSANNFYTACITELDSLTASANNITVNQKTLNSMIALLTGVNYSTASNQEKTNTLLDALTAREYEFTISAQEINLNTDNLEELLTATNTFLDILTSKNFSTSLKQDEQITLLNVLTANSIYGTVSAQPLHVIGSLSAVVLNPVTAVNINNDVQVHASSTFPISGSITVLNPVTAMNVTIANSASSPALVSFADSVQLDQSSRLRVSTVGNQWWYTSSVDKDGDLRYIESFVNAASSTFVHGASSRFVQNLASVNLTSGLSATGSAIRASRRRHKLIPGTSHEYFGTWNWDGQQTNVVKRMGMFTNFNGFCFELSETDFNILVRRRLTDGTLVEERVERKDFNSDKLDGTGPSGENWGALTTFAAITGYVSTTPINIGQTTIYNVVYGLSAGQAGNFRQGTKATISGMSPASYNQVATIAKFDTITNRLTATYLIDPNTFSSLTVSPSAMVQTAYHMQHTYWFDFMGGRTNRVRFGKVSDYGNIVLHTYRFDGLLGTAYENAPALMDRKEIFNVGPVSGTPSFTVISNSFNIEAEANLNPSFGVAFTNQNVTFNKDQGQEFAILGIGLREGEPYQRADLQVQRIQVVDVGNINQQNAGVFQWRLVLNPTFGGTAVPTPIDIGKATHAWDYATGTTITGGINLIGGYVQANTTLEVQTALNFLNMGSNIEYTATDKAVLVLKEKTSGTSNALINASINFIEAL